MNPAIDIFRRWRDRLRRISDQTLTCDDQWAAYRFLTVVLIVAVGLAFCLMAFQNYRFEVQRKILDELPRTLPYPWLDERDSVLREIDKSVNGVKGNQRSIESLLDKFKALEDGQEEIKLNQEEIKTLYESLRNSLSLWRVKNVLPVEEVARHGTSTKTDAESGTVDSQRITVSRERSRTLPEEPAESGGVHASQGRTVHAP